MWNLGRWYWWTYLQGSNGSADIEQTYCHGVGSRGGVYQGEGGTNRESSMEIHTLTYVKERASGNLLCESRNSNRAYVKTLRGVMGWEVGGRFQREGTYVLLLLLSHFSHVQLCATTQTAAHQAPPSLGFPRQEHWSGLPFPSPMHESEKWKWSHSVVSDSQRPHGLQPSRLLRPRDFPGKSTGLGCHCLLRDICTPMAYSYWCMAETNTIL